MPENWPQYQLKLSDVGNFSDIFESGLQPHYVPGMEGILVEIKHARISITQSNGRTLPEFEVEYSEVRPLANGTLYKVILVSQPLTISQASVMAKDWLPYIERSEEELRQFLEAVRSDPVRFSDENYGAAPEGFSGGWSGSVGERFSVWFRQNYNVRVPLRLCLRINYRKAHSLEEFTARIESPIKAPEGYVIRQIENFGPDDTAEMMYAKGIPFLPGRGLSGADQSEVIKKSEKEAWGGHLWGNQNRAKSSEDPSEITTDEKPRKIANLLWMIAGGGLLGIFVLLLRALKGKATR